MKFEKINGKIKIKTAEFFIILLYLIAISAYQLGRGFDAFFVRSVFAVMVIMIFAINKKIVISDIFKWSIVFWGFYFSSCIWAKNPTDTLDFVNNAIQIILVFLVIPMVIKDRKDFDDLLKLIIISLLYTACLLIIRTPVGNWGTERIGEVVGLHSNDLGFRMAIGAMLSLYFLENKKDDGFAKKIFYIISIIIFSILTLFSGSKKALLILLMGCVSFEFFTSKGSKGVLKFFIVAAIALVLTVMLFTNDKLYSVIGVRLERTFLTVTGQNISSNKADGSLIERKFFMKEAIELFSENPIIGYGGNNFKTRMREINYKHIAYSHNNYTELLSTLGIFGFSLYYSYWLYLLVYCLKNIKKIPDNKNQNILFLLIIGIILILDYGTVSYIKDFNAILLVIIDTGLRYKSKSNINERNKNAKNSKVFI